MKSGLIIVLSLFYFTEINAQTSKHKMKLTKNSWYVLNDDVMGGVSKSNVVIEDNHIIFSGKLSSKYNGGFASIRIRENFNVHERDKIVIKVLGDENTYQLRIKDNYLNEYSYVMEFSSNKEEEIEFILSDFKPIFRGTYLNLENFNKNQISEIAFMIVSNKEPSFKLKIFDVYFK